jgi:hypothetical protein
MASQGNSKPGISEEIKEGYIISPNLEESEYELVSSKSGNEFNLNWLRRDKVEGLYAYPIKLICKESYLITNIFSL